MLYYGSYPFSPEGHNLETVLHFKKNPEVYSTAAYFRPDFR